MQIVTLIAAAGGLQGALVEALRKAWGGGEAVWLSPGEAAVLADDRPTADYFDRVVQAASGSKGVTPKLVSNWITGELFRLLSESGGEISTVKIEPAHLVALIELVNSKAINMTGAKKAFGVMFQTGQTPQAVVKELGLEQISDSGELTAIVRDVISRHPGPVEQFQSGKEKVIGFLVGQVMRATRGKANPKMAEQMLRDEMQK